MVDDVEWRGGSYVVCGGHFNGGRMSIFNLVGVPSWRLHRRLAELWPAQCLNGWQLRERERIEAELQSRQP